MLQFNAVIIGSGAAGYAVADRLLSFGMKNIAMLTYSKNAGTSRNAGSDKQTYYKLSCTDEDSPIKMANALSFGGGMNGDTAFAEAANSMRCFNHLVEYGVPFPTDRYGRFIGYKTDHDNARRGTSAGPLTSKYMTECLEKNVLNNNEFTLLDETAAIRIVTENNRAVGVIALQKNGSSYRFLPIQTKYIIAATGGAATVYKNTVYPDSQAGAFGLLAEAGCKFCNLTEWQYGIASLGVKWNLSGSYQQVIPTYYSVDENGNKTEFLNSVFNDVSEVCDNIFLKGYQWPFDSKKIHGSSKIDLAVSREKAKGHRVYMDYRNNPEGFDFEKLGDTAKEYLLSAGADGKTPFDRLSKLNPQAIAFYKSKGIDLSEKPLEIVVCAQHINGGVDVDINWQTSVENLFAVGETAGTFGIYRPGGSALNSTQVGALRAAEYISRSKADFGDESLIYKALWDESDYLEKCRNCLNDVVDFSEAMSIYAAENRNLDEISTLKEKLKKQCDLNYYYLCDENYETVLNLYRYKDTLRTQLMLCCAFVDVLPETGSRGGAMCTYNGAQIEENEFYRDFAVLTDNENRSCFVPLRKISDLNYSFEAEWNRFNSERGLLLYKKKTAVFLTAEEHNAKRVYDSNMISQLRERYDLYETVLCRKNIKNHMSAVRNAQYIFSTWGMEHFSEEEIKEYFPNVKCLFYAAGSVQHFASEFLNCGIRVFSAWKANAVPVAEYTYAQILLALKGFYRASGKSRTHYYQMSKYADKCGGVYNAKIGIIGVGSIGGMVAEKLMANDVEVYYYDPYLPKDVAEKLNLKSASLEEIFSSCDVITNHLANKEELTGILSGNLFDSMKPYAVFINTGRGRQVDEKGLVKAMRKVKTRTALLDVLVHEPLNPFSAVAGCKNIIVTPHIAGSLGREVVRMAEYMLDDAQRIDNGKNPLYEVTVQMLKTMA